MKEEYTEKLRHSLYGLIAKDYILKLDSEIKNRQGFQEALLKTISAFPIMKKLLTGEDLF